VFKACQSTVDRKQSKTLDRCQYSNIDSSSFWQRVSD